MNEELWRSVALLSPLVSAVVAGFLASALTLRRVKREKRWDARHEAYKAVLRSLSDMRFWAEETYADAKLLPSVGAEKLDELRKRFDNAKHKLWSYVHVGRLDISQQCSESLSALLSSIAAEEHRFEEDRRGEEEYSEDLALHAERVRNLIDSALPNILAAAQKDLA